MFLLLFALLILTCQAQSCADYGTDCCSHDACTTCSLSKRDAPPHLAKRSIVCISRNDSCNGRDVHERECIDGDEGEGEGEGEGEDGETVDEVACVATGGGDDDCCLCCAAAPTHPVCLACRLDCSTDDPTDTLAIVATQGTPSSTARASAPSTAIVPNDPPPGTINIVMLAVSIVCCIATVAFSLWMWVWSRRALSASGGGLAAGEAGAAKGGGTLGRSGSSSQRRRGHADAAGAESAYGQLSMQPDESHYTPVGVAQGGGGNEYHRPEPASEAAVARAEVSYEILPATPASQRTSGRAT